VIADTLIIERKIAREQALKIDREAMIYEKAP